MEDNSYKNRRSILKSLGAGIGASGLAGLGAASSDDSTGGQTVGVQTETLSADVTNTYFEQAQQTETAQALEQFLTEQGLEADRTRLTGTRVSADFVSEHVSLKAPFQSSTDTTEGYLDLRVFDGNTVTAKALVGETVYVADQFTLRSAGTDVMTELDREQLTQSTVGTQVSRNCSASYTFNGDGYGCKVLQGLAAVGAGVLTLIPEPSSTAVGTVALAGILGGGCTLFEAVNKYFDDCDVGKLKLCVVQPCTVCTPSLYLYPVDCA
jgi:hypothetical protein